MQAPRHTIVDGAKPTPWLPSNFDNRMGMPNAMAKVADRNPSANPACTTMACKNCLLAAIPCETSPHLDLTVASCNTCRRSLSIVSAHCHKQRWLSCRNQPSPALSPWRWRYGFRCSRPTMTPWLWLDRAACMCICLRLRCSLCTVCAVVCACMSSYAACLACILI